MKREFLKKIVVSVMATLIFTNMYSISASAKWSEDSNGGWNWIEDGEKAFGWKKIDSKWYYFNEDGLMKTGWVKDKGIWYNLSDSGEITTGWKSINGKWYHFNEDGQMEIGWINDNGVQYFTNLNGEMQTGTIKIDEKTYTFSDDGALLSSTSNNQERTTSGSTANAKDLETSKTGYVSTNSDVLNVRADATLSSDIIGTVAKGAEVKIVDDEKNGFYPIILSGKTGWVSSKWINVKKSENVIATPLITNQQASDVENTTNTDSSLIDEKTKKPKKDLEPVKLGDIRNTKPSLDNKYYYSDENLFYKVKLSPPFSSGGKVIKGNCTWYAWGRAWEITGNKPDDAGFIGNAYEWWAANKKSGKYQYGSEPKVGAIAVWKSSLPGSDGSGHVAVIEKIENGKIYISESTWHGVAFNYREIYDTSYLYGYIYLDEPNY
ncbi:surface antigen [Clostridium saccharoperbutylacetonicum]|uniref:N-acetylmuramoyl-L-alanine amidase n=1 Tax=Clostridium saccharoperbutylacetonicum N1-4(HMT) TaxID=931276 RepID=M1MXU0_9CLOT|nr:CHAP domain-containing protein [Clostridium saccharoperbutylacetonicum]AGF59346.1 CHAP domain-containing protein,SH3 domain-containing protein,putative cell wall binding protein [Clostridium saccharoperbutylacetonicum N1-4(HMT)]NRT59866.1 surface antigen [Clostridium saccharoperbutylacetonicum]NSB23178.1 surface antigen [Clostridium saccharoperbutylacetonicum]NSB42548.1 surface antigen [Clostridium saccharoperbutylacetonicum]